MIIKKPEYQAWKADEVRYTLYNKMYSLLYPFLGKSDFAQPDVKSLPPPPPQKIKQ